MPRSFIPEATSVRLVGERTPRVLAHRRKTGLFPAAGLAVRQVLSTTSAEWQRPGSRSRAAI